MGCRNCCQHCRSGTPQSWAVQIDEETYVLRRSKVTAAGFPAEYSTNPALNRCVWLAEVDFAVEGCETPAAFIQLMMRQYDSGLYITLELLGEDGFTEVIMRWAESVDTQTGINCMTNREMPAAPSSAGFILVCPEIEYDPVTIIPVPSRCACPCGQAPCCGWCRGGIDGVTGNNETALRWSMEIAGETIIARRPVSLDASDLDGACVWRGPVNKVLCSLMAKSVVVRAYAPGSIPHLEVKLLREDGTVHSTWLKTQLAPLPPLDCAAPVVAEFVGGLCAGIDEITLTPIKTMLCEQEGSGGAHCTCCPLADDPDEIDVDLGSAGFFDINHGFDATIGAPEPLDCDVVICDTCPDVGDVYTAARTLSFFSCAWRYTETICEHDAFLWNTPQVGDAIGSCGAGTSQINIVVERRIFDDACVWRVVVSVTYNCGGSSSSEGAEHPFWAEYRSDPSPPSSCALLDPLTLNKWDELTEYEQCPWASGNNARPPTTCLGEWPDTITIQGVQY
jgi:hypothetical protein